MEEFSLPETIAAPPAAAIEIKGLPMEELRALLTSLGQPAYRAQQVFDWLHKKRVTDPQAMKNLPQELKDLLSTRTTDVSHRVDKMLSAADGTKKFRLQTPHGDFIEVVYLPAAGNKTPPPPAPVEDGEEEESTEEEETRATLCVSTQVGCAMKCRFCYTATMGLKRHLSAAEIVDEVYAVERALPDARLTNLVFMGMGEPLHNFDNTVAAIKVLLDQKGHNFSARKITVSTSGLAPRILPFFEAVQVKMAISLNGTTDEQRSRIMPVNKAFPIEKLLAACREYTKTSRRKWVTFEYVLLDGINDSLDDAKRLIKLSTGIRCKINLIALNEFPGAQFASPPREKVLAFQQYLMDRQVTVFVRKSRGREILAACGQLVGEGLAGRKNTNSEQLA